MKHTNTEQNKQTNQNMEAQTKQNRTEQYINLLHTCSIYINVTYKNILIHTIIIHAIIIIPLRDGDRQLVLPIRDPNSTYFNNGAIRVLWTNVHRFLYIRNC